MSSVDLLTEESASVHQLPITCPYTIQQSCSCEATVELASQYAEQVAE